MRACKLCGGSAYVPYAYGCQHDFGEAEAPGFEGHPIRDAVAAVLRNRLVRSHTRASFDHALELMVPMGTSDPITVGAVTRAEWRTYLGRSDTATHVACAYCRKTADRVPLRMDGVQLATHPEGWSWVQGPNHGDGERACSDACAGMLTRMVEEEAAARDRAAAHWAEWKRKRGYTP